MSNNQNLQRMFGVALLAMMFGAGGAYAQAAPQSSDTASAAGSSKGASLGKSDQRMMDQLARDNMAEIEAAKIALTKSKDEQVRNFAQKMVDDHTKAGDQLKGLAQAKGVSLPTTLDARHKAEIDRLGALSGDKFDKAYIARGGVTDHRQAHELLGRIEKQAKDTDLKALASSMMPVIDSHWKLARQTQAEVAGASSTGSSGTKGSSSSSGASHGEAGQSRSSGSSAGGMSK